MPIVKVSAANLNLPYKRAFLEGSGSHVDFLGRTGYAGFEIHPLRSRLAAEILAGKQEALDLMTSFHQSFSGDTLNELVRQILMRGGSRPSKQQLQFAALLPSLPRSMEHLKAYQVKKDTLLRAVLYPNEQQPPSKHLVDYRQYAGLFAERLWQPTAEVLYNIRAFAGTVRMTLEKMTRFMTERGFDNLCVDTFHWVTARSGHVMPQWQEALPILAANGHISEVHFGPARIDFQDGGAQLQAILQGRVLATEAGKMLATILQHWPEDGGELYIVTELTQAAVEQLGYKDYQAVHRDVVAAIHSLAA